MFRQFFIFCFCLQLGGKNEPTVTVKQIPLPTSKFNINENSLPTDRHMIVKCNNVQIFVPYFGTSEFNINEASMKCRVAGWGRTETVKREVNDLMEAAVSIINLQACKEKLPHLPANVICGAGGSGFCQVCFLSFHRKCCFWSKKVSACTILNEQMKLLPPHRVILVVLWCATGWLLVWRLTSNLVRATVWTRKHPTSTRISLSFFPGSTAFYRHRIVKCNNVAQSFASYFGCEEQLCLSRSVSVL